MNKVYVSPQAITLCLVEKDIITSSLPSADLVENDGGNDLEWD